MKFETNRDELLEALQLAVSVTDPRATMPMLSMVLITAEADRLTVAATSLRQFASSVISGSGKPGTVAVSAKGVVDRVRSLDGETITLEEADGKLLLKSGTRKFSMFTTYADDFPKIPRPEGDEIVMDASKLAALIGAVSFSVCPDPTRAHMNSLFLEMGDAITATSTDGHRCTTLRMKHDSRIFDALIPLASLRSIRSLCERGGSVSLVRDGNCLSVRHENSTVGTILSEPPFPPYQQVIPKSFDHKFECQREPLRTAIVALMATGGDSLARDKEKTDRAPMVVLRADGDTIRLEARNVEGEVADDVIECEDCGKWAIKVQSRYLTEALGAVDCDTVTIGINGELDPFYVEDGAGYRAVIMPTRM